MSIKEKDLYIVGCGGKAKEVFYCLKENSREVTGFVDKDIEGKAFFMGLPVYDEEHILSLTENIDVVITVGNARLRRKIAEKYIKNKNISFPNVISRSAILCGNIDIGRGNIIDAGAILTTDIKIGDFGLINIGATIGHDVVIGNFSIINPGSNISGNVCIGDECEIGTGTKIIQGKTVADKTVVGAGTVIIEDIKEPGCLIVGVPGRIVRKSDEI